MLIIIFKLIRGKGWINHINLQHNVYHYLDFLIYIKNKESNDCTGIEKYVKDNLESEIYFPI